MGNFPQLMRLNKISGLNGMYAGGVYNRYYYLQDFYQEKKFEGVNQTIVFWSCMGIFLTTRPDDQRYTKVKLQEQHTQT
jgi:hypothetical protein